MADSPLTKAAAAPERKWIHQDKDLCKYLLRVANASIPLELRESKIPGAGTGLFAVQDIPAGAEIFRITPIIAIRDPRLSNTCDYCFKTNITAVRPDGYFYNLGDQLPVIETCDGCGVVRYCSKHCQELAWQDSHHYECETLKANPDIYPSALALVRLLTWDKEGLMHDSMTDAFCHLETRIKNWENSDEADKIMRIVEACCHVVGSTRPRTLVRYLYCAILINSKEIKIADKDASYGISLDFVTSMINHSCNRNAFVFFEEGVIYARSLKAIGEGEEITVSYLDPEMNVLKRREELKKIHFIDCNCERCVSELAEYHRAEGQDRGRAKGLVSAQTELKDKLDAAQKDFYHSCLDEKRRRLQELDDFIKQMGKLAYPDRNGAWPDNVEPLPTIRIHMALMYSARDQYPTALRYAVHGFFCSTHRKGPLLVHNLDKMVRILADVGYNSNIRAAYDGTIAFSDKAFPVLSRLRNVGRGYIMALWLEATVTFGADCKYVLAMGRWARRYVAVNGEPSFGTKSFETRFKDAQEKLLEWAGVPAGPSMGLLVRAEQGVGDLPYVAEALAKLDLST